MLIKLFKKTLINSRCFLRIIGMKWHGKARNAASSSITLAAFSSRYSDSTVSIG